MGGGYKYFCPKEKEDYDFKCTRSDKANYIDDFIKNSDVDFVENQEQLNALLDKTDPKSKLIFSFFSKRKF